MKDNKSKNIVSILMVIALLFLCVGITYTALTYINKSDDNSINIGRISMSYSEPSNDLELINALPMSDEEGINQTNFFEFTVSSNATTNANDDVGITIPYEVNISDIEIDTDKTILPKDKIKVVLTKVVDGAEEKVIEPSLISNLTSSTLNTGSVRLYDTKNIHKNNNSSITTRYRLRAWIDKDFELDNTLTYQYKFRVNVNSNTSPLSLLKVNKIMLEVWESNKTAMSNSDDSIMRLANEEDGRWVEVLDEKTLTKDDRIRITFIYNNNIKGVAPTLSLKFGESVATGTMSNGTIVNNKLSYEYTISKDDKGKIAIKDLIGGSIKDEVNNTPSVLTKDEKESLNVNVETPPTFAETLIGKNNANIVISGDGLYKTIDTNDGSPSYYYKGIITNNYVKLTEKDGDAIYRIVRINEDGSIRLIRQDGINSNANYQFNPSENNYSYMYYSNSNVDGGIMKRLNDWYAYAIEGTSIGDKIVKSNFCEQAKSTWYDNTSYLTAGNETLTPVTNDYEPSLKCIVDRNGKGPLKMKVGLLMADEAIMAGYPFYTNTQTNNTKVYLQNGTYWWTMSSTGYVSNYERACTWGVDSSGNVGYSNVCSAVSVRPVLSLSADVLMSGKGTISEPFEPIL